MYRSNRSCLRLERIVLTLYINVYVSPYFGLAKVAEFNHLSYNETSGAPNENIVQNYLNIALLNVL